MKTCTERKVPVSIACRRKFGWVDKVARIAVGGTQIQYYPGMRKHPNTTQFRVSHQKSGQSGDRRRQTPNLFHVLGQSLFIDTEACVS
jgi:hypothetical protein